MDICDIEGVRRFVKLAVFLSDEEAAMLSRSQRMDIKELHREGLSIRLAVVVPCGTLILKIMPSALYFLRLLKRQISNSMIAAPRTTSMLRC